VGQHVTVEAVAPAIAIIASGSRMLVVPVYLPAVETGVVMAATLVIVRMC
jgi:hypothetical protein